LSSLTLHVLDVISFYLPDILSMKSFSTSYDTETSLWSSWNAKTSLLPPLVTIFTPPAFCLTRWIQAYPSPTSQLGSGIDLEWVPYLSSAIASDYYLNCQPYSTAPTYSPGVCGHSQTLSEIVKVYRGDDFNWQGLCCNRYSPYTYYTIRTLTFKIVTCPGVATLARKPFRNRQLRLLGLTLLSSAHLGKARRTLT